MTSLTEKNNNAHKTKTCTSFCRDAKTKGLIEYLSGITGIYFDPFISVNKARVRDCPNGDNCRKAHHINELCIKPHILYLENKDMKDFNVIDGYLNMIKIFKKNQKRVSPEDRALIKKVLEKDNFIEILNLWIDLSIRYHKIRNELKDNAKEKGLKNFKRNKWRSVKPPSNSSSYQFPGDVPSFNFNDEDIWWAIHRKFKMCMKAELCRNKVLKILEEFRIAKIKITKDYNKDKTKKKKNSLTELYQFALNDIKKDNKLYVYNLCELEGNCKYGVHLKKDQICVSDFFDGKCDCKNKDLHLKLNELKSEAEKLDKSSSEYKKISMKISKMESDCKKVMIHYTDKGMIPANEQIKKYKEKKLDDEKKKKEELKKEQEKVEEDMKELDLDWDF